MRKPSFLAGGVSLLLMLAGCASPSKAPVAKNERWVAYYDFKEPAEAFADYDLVVFDAKHHIDLTTMPKGVEVLAYLSFGEENGYSEDLEALQASGAVVKKNPNWPAYVMDIRHEAWRTLLLEKRIPEIVAKGFDGLMLDTIESPLALDDNVNPRYFGLHAACVSLIREIHEKFPQLKLMQNRAFPLLHETSNVVDYVLAESVLATYDAEQNLHRISPPSAHNPIFDTLRLAQTRNPRLKIYTLDYWNMNDVKGVKFIYQEQRKRGFIPHVTTLDLRTLHDERRVLASHTSESRG